MNELVLRSQHRLAEKNGSAFDNPKADIQDASDKVKANLTKILVNLTNLLVTLPADAGSIPQLQRLTDTASKLFAWPNSKPVDSTASNSPIQATTVINLPLIRTTPEQMRAKAKARLIEAETREVTQSAAS